MRSAPGGRRSPRHGGVGRTARHQLPRWRHPDAVAHVSDAAAARGIDTAPLRAVQRIIGRAAAAGHGGDSYDRLAQFHAEADHPDAL